MINPSNFNMFAGMDPTQRNPGFFESAAMPMVPGVLPGVLTPIAFSGGNQSPQELSKNYMENLMKNMMDTSNQLQMSYAQFLGGGFMNT